MLGEGSLEVPKHFFLVRAPSPWGGLLDKVQEMASNVREGGDELRVEVAEAEKGSHSFDCLGERPFLDGLEFYQVHLYSSLAYYYSKILHFFG